MKVILKENIEKLGKVGEVVSVAEGYARNYLLPKKIVLEATESNLKLVADLQKAHAAKAAKEKTEVEALAKQMESLSLVIEKTTGEEGKLFGSVTAHDIAEALKAKGFEVDRRKIELAEPLKTVGQFSIPIALAHEIKANLSVQVVAQAAPEKAAKKTEKKPAAKRTKKADKES
jgi:large subunit ribosomal protein L9